MTAENLLARLGNIYGQDRTASRSEVEKHLQKQELLQELQDQLPGQVPGEVLKTMVTKKGTVDWCRFIRFRDSSDYVVRSNGPDALSALSPRCVRKDGSINQRRLRRNLKTSNR